MENINNKEEKKEREQIEEVYRVTVTKSTDEILTKVVDKINDGFEGGKINRSQAISWIITKFAEDISEGALREIRANHFDEIALLSVMLKQAKKNGAVPPELREMLQRQFGLGDTPNKKSRNRLTKDFINDEN